MDSIGSEQKFKQEKHGVPPSGADRGEKSSTDGVNFDSSEASDSNIPFLKNGSQYRETIEMILDEWSGPDQARKQVRSFSGKVLDACKKRMGRPLTEEETRKQALTTLARTLSAMEGIQTDILNYDSLPVAALTTLNNIQYARWLLQKEILMQHWNIDMQELETRKVKTGRRMAQFLQESLAHEGLV